MKKYIIAAILMTIVVRSFSNNITITNTTIASRNTVSDYALIQFDLSWDNSWRTSSGPSNWDAAWIFVKFKIKGQDNWRHATLNWVDGTGTGDGHTVPAGAVIRSSDNVGVFIYSSTDKAQSSAAYPGVQLRWNYGTDGLQDSDLVEICVFGVEMVYVPEGSFELGNLGFYGFQNGSTVPSSYSITGIQDIQISAADGDLYYNIEGDGLGPLSFKFPNGYRSFYCMKYEISQEQYIEFLLKLTNNQASTRAYTSGGNRNNVLGSAGTYSSVTPYVAYNFLSWADLAAYLDWAGLRPMTELEFEKACRGPLPAVVREYAWGTALITASSYTISNNDNEQIITQYNVVQGNALCEATDDNILGPVRVGIFASHPNNSSRVTAGSTYYGIMEMSGNVTEQVVSIGNPTGRSYQGIHGDGILDANGNHNVTSWPGINAIGAGRRGGSWTSPVGSPGDELIVSNRLFAATGAQNRDAEVGGRGVRTAP